MLTACDGDGYSVVMSACYAPVMEQKRKPGRPKVAPSAAFTERHVVNLTKEMDKAVATFCANNGLPRHTDGIRVLLFKALKAEGLL